jgi:hypothetical protein
VSECTDQRNAIPYSAEIDPTHDAPVASCARYGKCGACYKRRARALWQGLLPDCSTVTRSPTRRSFMICSVTHLTVNLDCALPQRRLNFDISASDAAFVFDLHEIPEERWTRLERKRMSSIFGKLPPPNVASRTPQ